MSRWKYVVEGWGTVFRADADMTAKHKMLAELLRASEWYASQEDGERSDLAQRLRELEHCADDHGADDVLWEIYNLADAQRAWLDPET